MVSTTRLFGIVLVLLGVVSYVATGRTSLTAMIPAFVGITFVTLARVASYGDRLRKHMMHAAVALGLVGAIAALARAVPAALNGQSGRPAVVAQLLMAILLLVYVALGVQSFIEARRSR